MTDPTSSSRRKLVLFGGAALLAVLAVVAGYFLVLPAFAGDDAPEQIARPQARASAAAPSAVPTPSATPSLSTFRDVVGRDPFAPLLSTAQPAAAGTATAGTAPAPAATATTQAGAQGGTSGSTATTAPSQINLLDVVRNKAGQTVVTLRLDTTLHLVMVKESVDNLLTVTKADPTAKTATFAYGEQVFTLKVGGVRRLS